MKRSLALVLAFVLLLVASPAFAYDSIVGCVTDAGGQPWTWGGTITCTRQGNIVVGTGTLGADGCFSVYIGNGTKTTCTFDFTPGPNGDPANMTCTVPTNNNVPPTPYTECNPSTGSGPNAVTLAQQPTAASAPYNSAALAGVAVLLTVIAYAGLRLVRPSAH